LSQMAVVGTTPPEKLPESIHTREPEEFAALKSSAEWPAFESARRTAIEVLTQALSSGDTLCREAAVLALKLCGPDAQSAVPRLTSCLSDPDETVRRYAAEALKKIQGAQDETPR
jgi:HEAT repeat protein